MDKKRLKKIAKEIDRLMNDEVWQGKAGKEY